MPSKKVREIGKAPAGHWVGDGFPVRSIIHPQRYGSALNPFILLDHAGPHDFPPAGAARGVGEHPHKGFETVTIVYSGEIAHRDSTGGNGTIGPGDVQWMTAGAGLVHEEMHSRFFTETGGVLDMVQLWVNLPAKDKGTAPRYQDIRDAQIPSVERHGATVRLIAGSLGDATGPANTFTPMNVWDVRAPGGAEALLPVPEGHCTAVIVLEGRVEFPTGESADEDEIVVFEETGDGVFFTASDDAKLLLLAAETLDEPLVQHGPFVMNTRDEVFAAMADYQMGRMGRLTPR